MIRFAHTTELKHIKRMNVYKLEEYKLLKEIQEMFNAELDEYVPTEDELQFLDERNRLEANPEVWSLEGVVANYEKLLEYGLVDKMLQNLAIFIVWRFVDGEENFMRSEFYQLFKDHKVVKLAYLEAIRRQNFYGK